LRQTVDQTGGQPGSGAMADNRCFGLYLNGFVGFCEQADCAR
jgi:hypothetical protein